MRKLSRSYITKYICVNTYLGSGFDDIFFLGSILEQPNFGSLLVAEISDFMTGNSLLGNSQIGILDLIWFSLTSTGIQQFFIILWQ